MSPSFDFIIVGSGPAGSTIASTLARSSKSPSVLLIEAGSYNPDQNLRVDGQRWITFQKNPDMNWGYKTEPQELCLNRQIDYSRGRALGGSSTINFGVYTIGARGDYDEWARVVGHEAFKWDNMQRRLKALETFHSEIPQGGERYAAPSASDHGDSGPIHVGYAHEWEKDVIPILDAFEQAGFPLNKDHNSGDPIGVTVMINSAHGGLRTTAADAIASHPNNLTILTDSVVQRLVMEGKKVIGVDCAGKTYLASKEVILSAGSLNSPQILMHSGIGPKCQLEKYGIPTIVDSPVGQGLRDHYFTTLIHTRAEGNTERKAFYGSQQAMDSALEQWKKDRTGDWAKYGCESAVGLFKSDEISTSTEFQSLPKPEQEYINAATVPHYEVLSHFPAHWFIPNYPQEHLNYTCLSIFMFNAQSRGEATLQSSDPSVPLKFDPKILSHPFDRRVALECLREMLKFTEHPAYAKDIIAPVAAPKSASDEDLLEYWRGTITSAWHMTGTCKMGKEGEPDAVVDPQFRVLGVENLRVADMSVLPVLPSAHTQLPAYVTGATCAEMLISEYGL